ALAGCGGGGECVRSVGGVVGAAGCAGRAVCERRRRCCRWGCGWLVVSAAGVALTERHRQAQLAVRALMLREFLRLWPLWRGDDETCRDLVAATIPLVAARYQVSAALASSFYQAFRFAENVPGAATPRVAAGFDPDAVTASMYVTGRVQ